jgi:dTDP-glucose 4,6-dehydratase
MKKLLVTGGAGFIGANFIRYFLDHTDSFDVYNLDKLTYAGDTDRLKGLESEKRYSFIKGDICDRDAVKGVFSRGVDAVVHFAAESHVDRSIEDADPFEATNVRGTLNLLEAARHYGAERFIHISTDEVYGELGETGQFTETTPLNPNSPYSASKASGDLFALAYRHTHGLPVVYAQGLNVREWLHVEDCSQGIVAVLERGREGEVYNIGSGEERKNIEVVRKILAALGKPDDLIEFVKDRPGHDFRYSLDVSKIKDELGWKPENAFDEGIERTVRWYVDNQGWWRKFL